ncbi:S24 family peptidase [Lacimicrobium alkaliphilum]|uniref:HNH nuclease domain-containing protein n=1 Tax=Lacimicrobium alkaliphilum TaxID=1526571 RepID=A0ABQ1R675_9ALTE|nr:S24 family peptidase [Lacimicrobium alkaliphilum]GGD59635.1 hypothetical protein GCM10011357_13690 [Lacimicrobium alkaliphilum]
MSYMQQQLAFITYIQRMLVEGDFSATYKFALLHALADLCIEHPLQDETSELVITLDSLVDKLIMLYWHHAVPFSSEHQGEEALLRQNSGRQSKLISILYECQSRGVRNIHQLKASDRWPEIYKATLRTLKEGPLWRLQILSKQEECFLYPHHREQQFIQLNGGIAHCFRRFYDLVVFLAKNAWLQKIQSIKFNQALIGAQSQLQDFLFGVDRNALSKVAPVLVEIQQNRCFYCRKPMKDNVAVDHFIPFSRYSTDLGHNFVAAHAGCNNSKRDHLAAQPHRERWQEQNLVVHNRTLAEALSAWFYCDEQKSLAVADWAYAVASSTGAKLWLAKDSFTEAGIAHSGAADTAPVIEQVAETTTKPAAEPVPINQQAANQVPYFPDLKIACGHFKTGRSDEVEMRSVEQYAGVLDPQRHFLARASGNSMNGGKNPVADGDLLLLEWVTPEHAGSITGQTMAIERQDEAGDNQYVLRVIRKSAEGEYWLHATNPDYKDFAATEAMRPFARLKEQL